MPQHKNNRPIPLHENSNFESLYAVLKLCQSSEKVTDIARLVKASHAVWIDFAGIPSKLEGDDLNTVLKNIATYSDYRFNQNPMESYEAGEYLTCYFEDSDSWVFHNVYLPRKREALVASLYEKENQVINKIDPSSNKKCMDIGIRIDRKNQYNTCVKNCIEFYYEKNGFLPKASTVIECLKNEQSEFRQRHHEDYIFEFNEAENTIMITNLSSKKTYNNKGKHIDHLRDIINAQLKTALNHLRQEST